MLILASFTSILPSVRWLGTCILLTLTIASARSDNARPDLLAPGGWQLSTPHLGDALLETLATKDAPGDGEALRLTVKTPSDPVWLIQFSRAIPAEIAPGHMVQLHFWARSATRNPLRATLEQPTAPYQGVDGGTITLTAEWQEYTFGGATPGFGPNGLSVHFQGGQQAGIIEIAGVTVTDEGIETVSPATRDALQPAQVQARIAKFRKGELTIRVVDAAGQPVPGAKVKVTQTRHAFLFGANFFVLNPADTSSRQQTYQEEFTALFNYATLPFYWGAFETGQGLPDNARLEAMARWSVAHGLTLKGHPLIYHEVWPAWAPGTPDAAIPLLKTRVSDLIGRYKDTVHYWDVLNEANSAGDHQPANGESVWIKRDGAASVVETALGWARSAQQANGGPAETFLYNDFDTGQSNLQLLTTLQTDGKLPDVIGIQSHMHAGNWPLTKAWQVCETFAKFGKPIHFTECTVLSGPKRLHQPAEVEATDWNSTPGDETAQAEYVAQFYPLLFSHPAVRAITWWDLWDQHTWMGAPGGLVHKDLSPKPAYVRLMDLIHRQWWTNASGETDRWGAYSSRVFYGEYRIATAGPNGRTQEQTINFPEAALPLVLTVRLP